MVIVFTTWKKFEKVEDKEKLDYEEVLSLSKRGVHDP
jgi:hypothetical protein